VRGYTVVTSAVALQVDYKWLDNLLSHHSVLGVKQARQGVSRTLPYSAIRVICVALELIQLFGASLPRALDLAHVLAAGETSPVAGNLKVSLDLEALDQDLLARLAYAVEVSPMPRRGRPPKQ
jgi:hypothetical protein